MARKTLSLEQFRMQHGYDTQPQKNSPSRKKATAPYNFVSLPEKILPAPSDERTISGEILLNIEARTSLFIGSVGSKSFAPVGVPIIPGSSLRGMFKNIFKVVTCGTFRGQTSSQNKGEDFTDEHIYFRCLMATKNLPKWMEDLNGHYVDLMTDRKTGKKNARPGFLICTNDNKYFIAPSIFSSDRKNDRIPIDEHQQKFHSEKSCINWDGTRAYIFTGVGDKKKFVRYTKLDYVDWNRGHWLALPDDVQTVYDKDRKRNSGGVNLFKDKGILKRAEIERLTGKTLPDVKSLIPCHYLTEDGQVTAFGHGQCFRIPYQKRIGDAVPKTLQDENFVDMSDAVFGKEKFWASRVYFEDATPENFSTLPESTRHPLMQPNPTSYQLYLEQNAKNDKLNHWDSVGAQIRGYKFYWHKSVADWQANSDEPELDRGKIPEKRLTKEITPLGKGSRFTSKIRFKNLSAVELGALMMIFDLNGAKNPAYKIGQGKPFGFGSVKISATLLVEDATAYTELFDANGWKSPFREENPAAYLDAFKNYLKERDVLDSWRKVMAQLKKILDWDVTEIPDWDKKVESMSGNVSKADGVDERFRQRVPLPTIFEVVR